MSSIVRGKTTFRLLPSFVSIARINSKNFRRKKEGMDDNYLNPMIRGYISKIRRSFKKKSEIIGGHSSRNPENKQDPILASKSGN